MTFRENDSVLEYQLKPSVIATTMNPMKPISSKDNDSTNEISKKDYKYISTDETSSVAGSIKSRGTIKTKRTTGNRDGLQEPLIGKQLSAVVPAISSKVLTSNQSIVL